jgi:hypothetical protein
MSPEQILVAAIKSLADPGHDQANGHW